MSPPLANVETDRFAIARMLNERSNAAHTRNLGLRKPFVIIRTSLYNTKKSEILGALKTSGAAKETWLGLGREGSERPEVSPRGNIRLDCSEEMTSIETSEARYDLLPDILPCFQDWLATRNSSY